MTLNVCTRVHRASVTPPRFVNTCVLGNLRRRELADLCPGSRGTAGPRVALLVGGRIRNQTPHPRGGLVATGGGHGTPGGLPL